MLYVCVRILRYVTSYGKANIKWYAGDLGLHFHSLIFSGMLCGNEVYLES